MMIRKYLPDLRMIAAVAKTLFSKIFSSKSVEKIARSSGAMVRDRKFQINKYVLAA